MMIFWQWTLLLLYFLGTGQSEYPGLSAPNLKKAYGDHYQGSLLYAEGEIKRANLKFKQAYQIFPDNYYYTISYGLSEGRLGHKKSALELMSNAEALLDRRDPDYVYKKSIASFLSGMVYCYQEEYGHAYRLVSSALHNAPDTVRLKSIYENSLGYLTLLNQSNNFHKSSELEPHIHIRKHDLERAREHFIKALEYDPENGTAFYNYSVLSDTLGLNIAFNKPSEIKAKKRLEPTFLYMHQKIIEDLKLKDYNELVFLVDVSGSMVQEKVICMGDTRFKVMKDLGRKVVRELPEHIQFGIGTIGGDCPDEPAKWKPAGSIDKKQLNTDLRFLIPDGTTPLLTMLLRSPELFSDSITQQKSVFLISDGANTCRAPGTDICLFAEELSQKGITVNVLTFLNSTYNNTSAFSEYICLADNTGGSVIYMDNYRCHFQAFNFDLVSTCQLKIPKLEKSSCWGSQINTLWMYFRQ